MFLSHVSFYFIVIFVFVISFVRTFELKLQVSSLFRRINKVCQIQFTDKLYRIEPIGNWVVSFSHHKNCYLRFSFVMYYLSTILVFDLNTLNHYYLITTLTYR